ncbi:MAG TPA: acyl carrier protein [Chitinivibrionales bacterium]|jgi:acyl carrier protein|nr:acyl carrier protein [Chitinivibrionales bacterium]
MTTSSIEQRVAKVIADVLKVAPDRIVNGARIKEDLGADSLDQVSLMMDLEREFEGSISDKDAQKAATVGDIVALITALAAAKPSARENAVSAMS